MKLRLAARQAWYATERHRLAWHRRHWTGGALHLVSVIIPTHNRVGLLFERCLPSVLAQTHKELEILVCAHGCTDDTPLAAQLDPRIKVIDVPRKRTYPPTAENHWLAGPVAPINAGLRAATGWWIARIDDDDIWTPQHIARLLAFARAGRYEFASASYERERNGVRDIVAHDDCNPPIGGVQTWLYRSYLKFMRANPDCYLKGWNRVNDTDLAERFRNAGVRIGHLNEVHAYVLPRPGESTVGLEAYRRDRAGKEAHFAL